MTADRRAALRTLGAGALWALTGETEPAPLFAALAGRAIPAGADTVATRGFARAGVGAARYRHDPAVDAGFVALHPRASFVAADGRGFRLAGPEIAPEQLGAAGDGRTNDQPAIQAAVRYMEATADLRTLVFAAPAYAVWSTRRTEPVRTPLTDGGVPIIIRRALTFRGRPGGGTTLAFRNDDGRAFGVAWQRTVDGAVWRGPGIFLRGVPEWDAALNQPQRPRAGYELPGITLIDMTLDGGADRGPAIPGVYPADPVTGLGWDITHKGIHCDGDSYTGAITLVRSAIVRFRGELIFSGGQHGGAITATDSRFAHSNADLINPCPGDQNSLVLVRCTFEDGAQGFEGWGGRAGRITDCVFRDCTQGAGRLQGGITNSGDGAGRYYRPRAATPGEVPWLTLSGVRFERCGRVLIGSWVRGTLEVVDTAVAIETFGPDDVIQDVALAVSAVIDRATTLVPLNLSSNDAPGAQSIRDVRVAVDGRQTPAARAAGRVFERLATYTGSFGPGVVIAGGAGVARRYPADMHQSPDGHGAVAPDHKPCFPANRWRAGDDWRGCETDVGESARVVPAGDHHRLVRSRPATGAITLATDGYADGHEVALVAGPGFPGDRLVLTRGPGLKLALPTRVLHLGETLRLRFAAGAWGEVPDRG